MDLPVLQALLRRMKKLSFVVFNTATAAQAKELAEADPAVKAGRLVVNVIPWWVRKGMKLR